MSRFVEYKIKSVNDIFSLSEKLKGWIFRGQSDSSWELSTTLERAAQENIIADLHHYEKLIISKFKQNAHLFNIKSPLEANFIDWASKIQHHGGPTRLLDFTESIFISTFFATQLDSKEAVIWAINQNPFFRELTHNNQIDIPREINHGLILYDKGYRDGSDFIKDEKKDIEVFITKPLWANERLALQQGLFVVQGNIVNSTFQDNLFKSLGIEDASTLIYDHLEEIDLGQNYLIKIIIPSSLDLKYSLISMLRRMNISDATLFPGLDGFSRSLKFAQLYADHSIVSKVMDLNRVKETIYKNRFGNN